MVTLKDQQSGKHLKGAWDRQRRLFPWSGLSVLAQGLCVSPNMQALHPTDTPNSRAAFPPGDLFLLLHRQQKTLPQAATPSIEFLLAKVPSCLCLGYIVQSQIINSGGTPRYWCSVTRAWTCLSERFPVYELSSGFNTHAEAGFGIANQTELTKSCILV